MLRQRCLSLPFAFDSAGDDVFRVGIDFEFIRKRWKACTPSPAYRCTLVREESQDIKLADKVTGSPAAISLGKKLLGNSPNEQFIAILLDTKNKVIGFHVVTVGVLDASLVHPREAFRAAIIANASSIILAHYHPSGDLTPSTDDWRVHRRLKDVGSLIGIDVLDSVIVSDTDGLSMAEIS